MKITEQIELVKAELSKLDYETDPLAYQKFSHCCVQIGDILKPVDKMNGSISTFNSLRWVINEYCQPSKSHTKERPGGSLEVVFEIKKKEAIQLMENLSKELENLQEDQKSSPLSW